MKQSVKLILLTLLTCLLATVVCAEEPGAAGKQAPAPAVVQAPAAAAEKPVQAAATQPSTHLGHVDLARIAAESETGKAGQAQFADLKKKLQGQIESRRKQLEKQKAAIEAKLKTYTAEQREAKAREFQKKVEEFQKFGMSAEKELQSKQEEFSESSSRRLNRPAPNLARLKAWPWWWSSGSCCI